MCYKRGDNNIKTNLKKKILRRPWDMVSHYFERYKGCTTGPSQNIERHNYEIISPNIIKCVGCGKILINKRIEHFQAIFSKRKMRNLDKNKDKGDVTIYRVYLQKDHYKIYLPFPGKSYVGQTVSQITVSWSKNFEASRWNKHLSAAFNPKYKDYHSKFSRAIRKHSNNFKNLARNLFKVEVLQIIKFQGDEKITQELANEIESFWIGYYHTQFDEFGWNLLPGGQDYHGNPIERIIKEPVEFENLIEQSIFIKWQDGPLEFIARHYRCNDSTVYEACYYWFGKNYREIRYDKIKRHLELLMLEGYKSPDVRSYFKLPKGVWAPGRIFNSWCEEIYGEGIKFNEKKNELLKEKFAGLIRFGYISVQELEPFFAGLGKKGIEYFLGRYMGGLKKSKFELFFRPRAEQFLKMGIINQKELLLRLGFIETKIGSFYYGGDVYLKMYPSTLINKIFGMDFESAKRFYRVYKLL